MNCSIWKANSLENVFQNRLGKEEKEVVEEEERLMTFPHKTVRSLKCFFFIEEKTTTAARSVECF